MSISPAQCRAARALVDMDQAELARRAVVPRDAIADFENGSRTPAGVSLAAIRKALEAAGVIFTDENGDGPGVRLEAPAMRRACLNLTWNVINPTLVSEMSVETKDGTGPVPPAQRGQSILSPVLKARLVKNPRAHEEIVADAEKKFSKTIAYLAK